MCDTNPWVEEQRVEDAGARRASQGAVICPADPGPDSDQPYDHHHPNCYCDDCLDDRREPIHGDDLPVPDFYQQNIGITGDRW